MLPSVSEFQLDMRCTPPLFVFENCSMPPYLFCRIFERRLRLVMDQQTCLFGETNIISHSNPSHKNVWSQLKQPAFPTCVPQVVIWEKKSHVWLFDDVWRWPMFSDFSCFLSKFPTLPYLRKWTFQNGGHIYRAEVVVGRGRPLLCTLTATAAGRRGSGTTDRQRGGGKPCWWSRSEHDLYPLVN